MMFYKIEAEITNMSVEEIKENLRGYDYTKLMQAKLTLFQEAHGKKPAVLLRQRICLINEQHRPFRLFVRDKQMRN